MSDKVAFESNKIIIVDADVVVRASLASYLRDCGLQVIEASDTSEARAVIEAGGEGIDIVLCDAGTTGTEASFGLMHWARENAGNVTVLLAGTVAAAADIAEDLCEQGPQHSKPYDPSMIVDAIRQALAAKLRGPN